MIDIPGFTNADRPPQALPISSTDDRESLQRNRAISADNEHREILVGLSRAESEWLLGFVNRTWMFCPESDDRDRFLCLYERHERARQSVVAAPRETANDD